MTPGPPDPARAAPPFAARRSFITLAAATLAAPFTTAFSEGPSTPLLPSTGAPMTKPTAQFATVNGLKLYYQRQGSGAPLVLLHGGVMPDCFGPNVEALAKGRQLIQVHLQGHGHTPDVDRPLRFESLADDVAALIDRKSVG